MSWREHSTRLTTTGDVAHSKQAQTHITYGWRRPRHHGEVAAGPRWHGRQGSVLGGPWAQGGGVEVEFTGLVGGAGGASRPEQFSEASVDGLFLTGKTEGWMNAGSAHARRQRALEEIPGDVDPT